MNSSALLACFTVAAAALALWLNARLGEQPPRSPARLLVHLALAIGVANVLAPALMRPLVGAGESPARTMLALFAILLPALVYAFLSGIWAFTTLQRRLLSR